MNFTLKSKEDDKREYFMRIDNYAIFWYTMYENTFFHIHFTVFCCICNLFGV